MFSRKRKMKIYVIKHKEYDCAYIRLLDPEVKNKTYANIFTPLRNVLTQTITPRASEEKQKIYAYLQEKDLLLSTSGKRNEGWSEDWELNLWHEDIPTKDEAKKLCEDLFKELQDQGLTIINSRVVH